MAEGGNAFERMCGIVGIAATEPVADRHWVAVGRDAMTHRGPDDVGEWWAPDGRVGFGHRRLAIVDLSPRGHQPMLDPKSGTSIVFNGEIYNFKELRADLAARGHAFLSDSDTEVILAAYLEWGDDCLAHLNGMFALALYDARLQRLFLARDRAGEKPLFYTATARTLRFASELKALLADSTLARRIDLGSLDCYLADGFVPAEQCVLQGVRKLPPAHAMSFDLRDGTARVWRYWKLPDAPAHDSSLGAEAELLDELERLLGDAVRRQLVADVPVGVLLSGGVDSSVVTALAARASSSVATFTVRFPGHREYDETEHARLIARHFGTRHVEIEADRVGVDLLPLLARQFDEPLIDSSMVPTYLVSRTVRAHCTVALGGDGGDELFGGYPHYDRLLRAQRLIGHLPRTIRRGAARVADALLPVGWKGRNWARAFGADFRASVPPVTQIFDDTARRNLMRNGRDWPLVAELLRERLVPRSGDLVQRATRLDFATYLAEDLLVKVDRASMLSSLEVRAPLLDARVIEYAFGRVPSALKTTPTDRKILLKKLAGRLLPASFDFERKRGFSLPLSAWLRAGPWREYFEDVLLDSGDTWFDRGWIGKLLAGESAWSTNAERLFGLVMLELWRREYRVEI